VPIVPVRAASDPYPGIVPSVSYPSEIPLGDTATITVKGKNYGGESPEAYLSISFPDNPSKLWISSSDAQNSYIAWPDDQIWGGYGQYQLKAKYPLAEAMEAPWSSGLQRYLTVKVVPKLAGTFTFYVKMTAKDNDQNRWLADPSTDGS